jgi:hypothetical protein
MRRLNRATRRKIALLKSCSPPARCSLLGRQVPLYLVEQPPAQIVRLQQVAGAAHRGSSVTGSRPRSTPTGVRPLLPGFG